MIGYEESNKGLLMTAFPDTRKISVLGLLVISAILVIVSVPGTAICDQIPKLGVENSRRIVPNENGFIQRWLILEPISANGDTQNAVQETVKTKHFPNELTMIPKAGQKVPVGGSELTWHAVDTDEYNVNLYYFADAVGTNCNNALFWAVVLVNCPEEMTDVRLAVGTNSASVWWVNGEEVIGIYGNRCTVIDDGVSKRLTLRKGLNVIRAAIVNASGAADFCARLLDSEGEPLRGYTVSLTETAEPATAGFPLTTPLKWKSSGVLVSPISDEAHTIVSVKDPTVVRYNDLWHIYATAYSTSARTWTMVYLNFKDWSEAPDARLTHIDVNPALTGYHCAPHLFYFTPHQKWYLIFQSQQPQYCTADDISRPETWTAPQDFFDRLPASTPRLPIDYHVICDDTHAYLFFTGDNGRFYRSRTTIEDFPKGMSDPEIAIQDSRDNLFEGSITYKIKGSNTYLTLIEALSPARYYRAWISDSLDGEWTPVPGADSWETPFAGTNNVTFADEVGPWTRDISHGELIRDGYDERMILDLNNLQMLHQGRDPASGGNYSLLPYRLALLTLDRSEQ
jgi:hypothetical protein